MPTAKGTDGAAQRNVTIESLWHEYAFQPNPAQREANLAETPEVEDLEQDYA